MMPRMPLRCLAVATLLLAAMVAPRAWDQTVEDAKAAFEQGDYAGALAIVRGLAHRGDPEAQTALGDAYRDGLRNLVPQDRVEAVRWYLLAAGQGASKALSRLSGMIREGNAVAFAGLRGLAEQGSTEAQYKLGVLYSNGEGVPKDNALAVNWFQQAAEQGDAAAQYRLAAIYDKGDGVPQNRTEAVRWYLLAAEQKAFKALSRFNRHSGFPRQGLCDSWRSN